MVKNIEPKLRKIGDYLKLEENTIFMIPEYQRAYSWGIVHCDKLWQDITDFVASENKDRYFFGTIIINCQDDDTKLDLIDGQQRTITFLLLLKALLLKINNVIDDVAMDGESESLYRGLKERRRRIMSILYKAETEDIPDKPDSEKDRAICGDVILLETISINELYKSELKTILQSVSYEEIENKVVKIPYKRKDNKYTNFFRNFRYFYEKIEYLQASKLNRITKAITDNCEVIEIKSWEVEQAITMFNSLNSAGLPLCDSDIISAKLYAVAKSQGRGKEFTEAWRELLKHIGRLSAAKIATMDSLLMQQMYYERAVKKEIVRDSGSVNVTTPGVRRYFTEINKGLLNQPLELCEKMLNLSQIWEKVSNYPVMQVLLKFNENSKLFLASYFYRFKENEISEERIQTILECMLRLFSILELVDTGYSSSSFKTFLFGEEVKFVNAGISEKEIRDDFDNHINKIWGKQNLKENIIDSERNSLVYLNEYLFARETEMTFALKPPYDIEHIMPDSGRNLQEIRRDAGVADEEEFNNVVNKLGNKILLEEKINRSIGNEWFRTKISTKLEDKTGYVNSSFPIANALICKYEKEDKPYWKKEDIKKATERAAERIERFIFGK